MAGFPMLFESFSVQERLMQKYIPDVYRHLVPAGRLLVHLLHLYPLM